MQNLFIGLLFVFLDFHLDLGAVRIGLIPDFVGYILIVKGLSELEGFNEQFRKARPLSSGMMVYSIILYGLDLFGLWTHSISYVLGLVSAAMALYISYLIVQGVREMEPALNRSLEADLLYGAWRFMAVFTAALYLLLLIPALGLVSFIVGVVIYVYFLYRFNRSKKCFYERDSLGRV